MQGTSLTCPVGHEPGCRTGALPPDEQLAKWLRTTVVRAPSSSPSSSGGGNSSESSPSSPSSSGPGRPSGCHVLLAANKCERRGVGNEALVAATLAESVRLGFGEPVALSAMTGEGLSDLYEALQPLLDPIVAARQAAVQQIEAPAAAVEQQQQGEEAAAAAEDEQASLSSSSSKGPLRVAVMGLPNVVSLGGQLFVGFAVCSAACRDGFQANASPADDRCRRTTLTRHAFHPDATPPDLLLLHHSHPPPCRASPR